MDHGRTGVYPLTGGFEAWVDAGYPTTEKEAEQAKEVQAASARPTTGPGSG